MNFFFKILHRIYRLGSWLRSRLQQRLTRSGWMILIAIGMTTVVSMDTEDTVAYQGLPTLLGLFAIAIVFSGFFRGRFTATRLLPRFATVGHPFRYRVMVKNLSAKTQRGLVLLEQPADQKPSFREWFAVWRADERLRSFRFSRRGRPSPFRLAAVKPAEVPEAGPGEEVEVQAEIMPLRRGALRLNGVALACADPFGLFRALARVPLPQTMLILPKRYLLPSIPFPGAMRYQEGGVALASSIGRSEEFVSLRDYRRGDPVRHIHWRSWAKADKPIVREFEDEFFVRHALVLDTFIDDPRSDAFEEAISVAASFACKLPTQESLLDLLFVGARAYCFTSGRSLGLADQMLEVLASVRPCQDETFLELEDLVLEHIETVSGCICVLLAWDEDRRRMVQKLKMLGIPVVVFVIVEPGQAESPEPGPMQDQPDAFHVLEAGKIEEGLARLAVKGIMQPN